MRGNERSALSVWKHRVRYRRAGGLISGRLSSSHPNHIKSISREVNLVNLGTFARRDVLKLMAGAAALPASHALQSGTAHAAGAAAYNPAGTFDLEVSEVEFRRNSAGRVLMARIYQP